jgi:N-methylhydantoinase A
MFLGVDTGGTFTDFVTFGPRGLHVYKVLSTPDDPSRAIRQGIDELGLDCSELHLVHGSTVATNAILERKGVRTLFVTHRGLEDLLKIGRQRRPELYRLCPDIPRPPVDRKDCFGISGRISAAGETQAPVSPDDLRRLAEVAGSGGYEAVAVCLLFSFLDPAHERQVAEALPEDLFVSLSHEVLSEYREYERAATTFLNAYVGPLVQRYLERLQTLLAPKHLFVMHSAGGVMQAGLAGRQAVRLVLSGPAGGLVAAGEVGRQLGEQRLLSFDMGGTSTDVALIQGVAGMTCEGEIAGLPVSLPMLDIYTIGAGGGSLAWIDEAGLPQVGPESAGARPGPACYGQGGEQPAVTDANLLLGRIPPDARLAGTMRLDVQAARAVFSRYGKALGLSPEAAAQAVIEIAEEHMAGALRVVSVQRGFDPADFALLCFGGAGGLHACALAEKLAMRKVIAPLASGAFSAFGMLVGRQQSEFSRSRRMAVRDSATQQELEGLFRELQSAATRQMQGLQLSFERRVDMCYVGQGFHLSIDVLHDDDMSALTRRFEDAHQQAYGHALERPLEIMTARLTAFVDRPSPLLPGLDACAGAAARAGCSEVFGVGETPHFRRPDLRPGAVYAGPALVLEDTATLWLAEGWEMRVSAHGHLLLEKADEQ